MYWTEVRAMFPDTFVLLEELKSQVRDGELYVDEVAVIRPLADPQEAMRELLKAKGDVFVYHTSNEQIVMPIRSKPALRGTVE